jgi:transposase-like protein
MNPIPRKSDGRRIFTDAFKRDQVERMRDGKVSVAELSRRLGIARSLLQRWKRQSSPEIGVTNDTIGDSLLRPSPRELNAGQYIHELQRLVGRQMLELELLRAELIALRKRSRTREPRSRALK